MDRRSKRAVSLYRFARRIVGAGRPDSSRPAHHPVAPARAYRTVTGKWEAPLGSPRSGSA